MKKELKLLRDIRHDNLNAFIGACTEPPNICIITEYCTRGSLKDVLENDDVKLDNMFIASLVGDIIRVRQYEENSHFKRINNSHKNIAGHDLLTRVTITSSWITMHLQLLD